MAAKKTFIPHKKTVSSFKNVVEHYDIDFENSN